MMELGVLLLHITAPALVVYGLSLIPELTLHAYKRFTLAAFAEASYNLLVMAVLFAGVEFLWHPDNPHAILAAGIRGAGRRTARLLIMLTGLWSKLRMLRPSLSIRGTAGVSHDARAHAGHPHGAADQHGPADRGCAGVQQPGRGDVLGAGLRPPAQRRRDHDPAARRQPGGLPLRLGVGGGRQPAAAVGVAPGDDAGPGLPLRPPVPGAHPARLPVVRLDLQSRGSSRRPRCRKWRSR